MAKLLSISFRRSIPGHSSRTRVKLVACFVLGAIVNKIDLNR